MTPLIETLVAWGSLLALAAVAFSAIGCLVGMFVGRFLEAGDQPLIRR